MQAIIKVSYRQFVIAMGVLIGLTLVSSTVMDGLTDSSWLFGHPGISQMSREDEAG
jgi:hypothetical protein